MPRFASLIVLAALGGLPRGAVAQSPADTLPFRAGQWGAQYSHFASPGGTFPSSGFGLLRFLSPRHAIVLDANPIHSDWSTQSPRARWRRASGTLKLGMRWHRATDPSVHQFLTVGANTTYPVSNRLEVYDSTGTRIRSAVFRATSAGVFLNVGSAWMVTSHLSLGAAWEATAARVWQHYADTQYPPFPAGGAATLKQYELGRIYMLGAYYF